MNYRWNWGILLQEPYWSWIWSGLEWTLLISLGSWFVALTVGTTLGIARTASNRTLRTVAALYVDLFRNIPPLVQLFLCYSLFPEVLPEAVGLWVKRDMPSPQFVTASVAIGLFMAARVAEQVRAGIDAAGLRLMPAALATGLRPWQAYRLIVLPLGLRAILKPLTSEFLITVKMSSISLTIGVLELTAESRHIENYTFQGFEAFGVATVLYLLLGLAVTGFMGLVDRWFGGDKLRRAAS
jgi:glutamate/aspartate transport system permease protein